MTREITFKLDKAELEAFRQDFVDRISTFDTKLCERNTLLQQFGEELETKVERLLSETRHECLSKLESG